jgi:hypothetical protein
MPYCSWKEYISSMIYPLRNRSNVAANLSGSGSSPRKVFLGVLERSVLCFFANIRSPMILDIWFRFIVFQIQRFLHQEL